MKRTVMGHDDMRDRGRTRLGQRGLTLLEVLIAVTILAVMGIIALEAFRLGHRVWERGEQRAEAEQRIRVVSGMLGQAFASLEPLTAEVEKRPVMVFRGSPDRVFFYGAPDHYAAWPYAGMARGMTVFAEPGKGLVMQQRYPLVEGDVSREPGGEIRVIDPDVTQIRFRYLIPPEPGDETARWVEAWDTLELFQAIDRTARARRGSRGSSRSPKSIRLPVAVEAKVTIGEQPGAQEYDFLLPIHVGHELL